MNRKNLNVGSKTEIALKHQVYAAYMHFRVVVRGRGGGPGRGGAI
jgi:hypothetical protein